jgi:hypothetical protein
MQRMWNGVRCSPTRETTWRVSPDLEREVHPAADAPFVGYVQTAVDAVNLSGTHVYTDEQHCIASFGSCIVAYSKQPPDTKYFASWHAIVSRLMAQQPDKLSILVVIDGGSRSPDESQRKLIASATQRYAHSIERFAYVVEGRGFAAAALRSAISLISLAARTPYRQKVFASVEEAGTWLAQTAKPGSAMATSALSALVHTMREKVSLLAAAPARARAAFSIQPPVSR